MKSVISSVLAILSFNAFASGPIVCSFTEPFFHLEVDVAKNSIIMVQPDWESEGDQLEYITHDISKSIKLLSLSKNNLGTIEGYDVVSNKKVFSAVINFKGFDGMSGFDYLYDARFDGHWGGCDSKEIPAIDGYYLPEDLKEFYENTKMGIAQCYSRAYGSWTSEASKYSKKESVFSILYKTEVVPGEPGEVSSSFSSAENAELENLVDQTMFVPKTKDEHLSHKENKIRFCDSYGKFLTNKFPKN